MAIPTAAAVVAVDQATKSWALSALEPGPCSQPDACIDLIGGVRFNLVFNTGAAFTRGSGYGPLIGVLAFIMTGVLLYLATKRTDRFGIVVFGALAGGAVGNLLDRVFRADDGPLTGAVIDFIDVGWWPVFNIADSAIVLGVLGVIIHAFVVGETDDHGDEPIGTGAGRDDDPSADHGDDGPRSHGDTEDDAERSGEVSGAADNVGGDDPAGPGDRPGPADTVGRDGADRRDDLGSIDDIVGRKGGEAGDDAADPGAAVDMVPEPSGDRPE